MNRKQLKANALAALKGNWGKVIAVLLVPVLIVTVLTIVSGIIAPTPSISDELLEEIIEDVSMGDFDSLLEVLDTMQEMSGTKGLIADIINLVCTFVMLAFTLPICTFFLNLFNGNLGTAGDLLAGVKARGWESIRLELAMAVKMFVRMLLGVLIFAGVMVLAVLLLGGLLPILSILVILADIVFLFIWELRIYLDYALSGYVKAENPSMGCFEALNATKALVKDYRKELLLLALSFFGWAFLVGFVSALVGILVGGFGIFGTIISTIVSLAGTFILSIYVSMTIVNFYKAITA